MKEKGLVIWLGGFAGILLIYAAYKNKSPLALIKQGMGQGTATSATAPSETVNGIPVTQIVASQIVKPVQFIPSSQYAPGAVIR